MITVRFGADALARVRFAISPLIESQLSVRVLDDPGAQALHLPWAAEARRRTAGLGLDVLRALQPDDVYSPDFVHPPPGSPLTELEDELAAMVATPPEQVRAEVRGTYLGRPLPPALAPFVEDPAAAVDALAQLVRVYWGAAWRRTGPGCARCSRATCSTARAGWPTAARSSCSPTSTRR